MLIFLRSTRRRNLPLGFLCAKMGLANFENGKTVMIPYLCIRVSSTIRSSFRCIGTGRFWLQTIFSSFGVSFTWNSVFIPISILCLANMSWYSTRISSTTCFLISVSSVWVQSNHFKNSIRDSMSSFGFNFSFCCNSHSYFGFVFESGFDPLCCQDFRVSETRK